MTDLTSAPTELHPAAHESDERPAIPAMLRILGGLGLAVLLVAVYAIVQFTSGGTPAPVPVQSGPDQALGAGAPPEAGTFAPDISVATLDGGSFSLSRHLAEDGRPVFVNMWAEWCLPCRAEMPAIEAVSQEHPEIHFIGVVIRDKEAPARSFVEDYGITYQIAMDSKGVVERDYLVWAMPSTYLIGPDGVVIERIFGPMSDAQLEDLVAQAFASAS